MSFFGDVFSGRGLVGGMTLGLSELVGEDTMSKVPLLGPLGGYESDEQKALMRKQKQMAEEAARKEKETAQRLAQQQFQQTAAFGPRNQMMARMFGPEAAFSAQQVNDMTRPAPRPEAAPELINNTSTDPAVQAKVMEAINAQKAWDAQEAQRTALIDRNYGNLPQGPTPLRPTRAAPARRY